MPIGNYLINMTNKYAVAIIVKPVHDEMVMDRDQEEELHV